VAAPDDVQRDIDREIERDVAMATVAHRRLLDDLDRLLVDDDLDVAAPSALPGWSVGHVITHVTNSGDGHALIFEAAQRGEIGRQYPHGLEGREVDIETGAPRRADVQVAGLRTSIERLEALWAASTWDGSGILAMGNEVRLADLPFLRLREAAIHHVDLRIGFGFGDLPPPYVRLEVRRMEMLWQARQPMGLTALPAAALALAPPGRLAWLMGRTTVEGLAPAGVF
jgi:maleylpyruvate isomerase